PCQYVVFFFSSRRRHTRSKRDWSSDVCSSDLVTRTVNRGPIKADWGRKPKEEIVMPENDETANAGEQDQTTEFKAPESQEELDRIIQKRIERERSRFSDYADLKAKAAQLDGIEESKKSEIEKATARVEELEAKLAAAELSVLKS